MHEICTITYAHVQVLYIPKVHIHIHIHMLMISQENLQIVTQYHTP